MKKGRHPKLSPTSAMHYCKLVFRSALFLAAAGIYLHRRITGGEMSMAALLEQMPGLCAVVWVLFAVEMFLRFFPARIESTGCQKQFARNYQPSGEFDAAAKQRLHRGVLPTVAFWVVLNGTIGGLYSAGVLDAGILLLISLAYSVCDMICILFFCPFQTWFMKNKCCTTCRIYNWDFAMMFTPLLFLPHWYSWSLLGLALVLLIQWEVLVRMYPQRFSEVSNRCLTCPGCHEKLCHHKTQLRSFWQKNREILVIKGNAILSERRKNK